MAKRPRDAQKSKVYKAEDRVMYRPFKSKIRKFKNLDEIAEYLDGILTTRWWRNRFPHVRYVRITANKCSDMSMAWPPKNGNGIARIKMGKNVMHETVVLHELAHTISDPAQAWHGQDYCRNYIHILRRFYSREIAMNLSREFDRMGVRWRKYKNI